MKQVLEKIEKSSRVFIVAVGRKTAVSSPEKSVFATEADHDAPLRSKTEVNIRVSLHASCVCCELVSIFFRFRPLSSPHVEDLSAPLNIAVPRKTVDGHQE